VSPKKRGSSKRPSHRKGLSGNPERRAIQLGQGTPGIGPGLLELARVMAGGAAPAPWWADSHEQILARARSLSWPPDPAGVEALTCQIVGDELFDRLEKQSGGFHLTGWLCDLIEATGTAVRDAVAAGSEDWPQFWALLRGLMLTAPDEVGDFPGIESPLEVARAVAEKTAALLPGSQSSWTPGARPAGEPMLARDTYGSRFLFTVPFGYPDGDDVPVDHWYAWDIDLCWIDMALNADVFGSPEDALKEWSDATGPAATASALAPCPEDMIPVLLYPFLESGPFAEAIQGGEPRPLMREYYRLRRRAREITAKAEVKVFDPDRMVKEFSSWYRTRHGEIPDTVRDAAATIADHWGPHRCPDERTFRACSPHRIRQAAVLIRNLYLADDANQAVRLLPEWTQWCIDTTGLTGPAAERALQTAAAEAANLVEGTYKPGGVDDTEPFRVRE
jgi:hypothetical protein